jgi:23S rRNA pseudouridine2605 synthase
MTKKTTDDPKAGAGERIAKVMARAGLCSRREAETWIAAGRVTVNGEMLTSAARNVTSKDDVRVDGTALRAAERTRLWRYHKPAGLVTSHRDEKNRQTVFDALPKTLPRVVSVGRLDLNSEGLLLLTNDGALARDLELPAKGLRRRYRVRVHGRVTPLALSRLANGIVVDGLQYGPIEATIDAAPSGTSKANAWLMVTLTEGKNREVRKVLEALGLSVNRLIRVAYGPFQLGPLKPGDVEEVPRHLLREQLGVAAEPDEKADPRAGWAKARPKPKNRPRGKTTLGRSGKRKP